MDDKKSNLTRNASEFTMKRSQSNFIQLEGFQHCAKLWIEGLFNEKYGDKDSEFPTYLKDGVLLSRLLNKIQPGIIKSGIKPTKQPIKMLENIRICLNAGQAMGIKSSFQPTDLVQDQNLMAVYTFLNELAQKAAALGIQPVWADDPNFEIQIPNKTPEKNRISRLFQTSTPTNSKSRSRSQSKSQDQAPDFQSSTSQPFKSRSRSQSTSQDQLPELPLPENMRMPEIQLEKKPIDRPITEKPKKTRTTEKPVREIEALQPPELSAIITEEEPPQMEILETVSQTELIISDPLPILAKHKSFVDLMNKTSNLTVEDRHAKLCGEILITEKSFLSSLETMIKAYFQPLIEFAKITPNKKITPESIQAICSEVEAIYPVSNKLYTLLEERIDKTVRIEDLEIGDIFISMEEDFKTFSRFSINYEKGLELIVLLREEKKFREFLNKIDASQTNGLELQDHFITPIQRLPRYSLLLGEILKISKPEHKDYQALTKALDRVKAATNYVNESIKSNQKLLEFTELLHKGKLKSLLIPRRKFIYMDTMKLYYPKLKKFKPTLLIMFNDILVNATEYKKGNENEISLPLHFTWIKDGMQLKVEEETFSTVEMLAPEKQWIMNVTTPAENEFIRHIKKAILTTLDESLTLDSPRNGTWKFANGSYTGEWRHASFFGKGTWVNSDGKIYDGYWDSNLLSAIGTVSTSSKEQYAATWSFKENAITELPPDEDVSPTQVDLSPRDWTLIRTGHTVVSFAEGQVIIKEGTKNENLYQVYRGRVRVEKLIDGKPKILGYMEADQMFGEMSILGSQKTNVSIVAGSQPVELYVVALSLLYNLFKSSPGLSKRFWRGIATKLADRLTKLHTDPSQSTPSRKPSVTTVTSTESLTPPTPSKAKERSATTKLNDEEFRRKFSLNFSEIVVNVYGVTLEATVLSKYGNLYVSQNFVCFYAKVFGSETKKLIPLYNVTDISKVGKSKLMFKGNKMKYIFKFDESVDDALLIIHGIWKNSKNMDSQIDIDRQDSLVEMGLNSLSEHSELLLSHHDWEYLIRSTYKKTFTKNQTIIREGEVHNRIFQIAKGKCRIEKTKDDSILLLGSMGINEVFGEISFLQEGAATASIVADSDEVDIYIFEGYSINILFATQPELASRFFYYLSTMLSSRFEQREKETIK